MGHINSERRILLCSECFNDHGLMLDAFRLGVKDESKCPNCGSTGGQKLDKGQITRLAYQFFVRGTIHKMDYGGAPAIQFNERQQTSVTFADHLQADARLIEQAIGVGFFHYGPRLWMVGEVEPLKGLQDSKERWKVIEKIFKEYPTRILSPGDLFYRLRIDPQDPNNKLEYDSPPNENVGQGRLDSVGYPALYASQDMEICIHECRATADDLIYAATLTPNRKLRVLDLSTHIKENKTEFESLDMAIHMLFLAGEHSYSISRYLAKSSRKCGFDGIVYPSYFSLIRTGTIPFETMLGISIRRIPDFSTHVRIQTLSNFALFGRPIAAGVIDVVCINRVLINQVAYGISFGPVEY